MMVRCAFCGQPYPVDSPDYVQAQDGNKVILCASVYDCWLRRKGDEAIRVVPAGKTQ